MKKLLSLILALAMVLALVACGNKTTDDSNAAGNGDTTDADPIRIGFFAPVSAASAAADGQSAEQSAKLAVKLINEAGGINGRKVELVNYDDGLDTAEKIAGYTKRHYEVFEFGFWAVEEKKSGNLAGVVGFRIPQDDAAGDVEDWLLSFDDENILDDTLELGYHIFPEYRRQGYAKEACLAAVEYAKEEFGTVQFLARIEKDNIVSKKVAERLGFVRAA